MTPVATTLGAVLVASFIGSPHCAGMCGPLAAVASASKRPLLQHGLYALGRLLGYLLLGAVAGSFGALIASTGTMLGIQRLSTAFAGGVMILAGAAFALARPGALLPSTGSKLAARSLARIAKAPTWFRGIGVGIFTAALPCGWLWAYVIAAAATGAASTGAALMSAFWLGSVPILALSGLGGGRIFRGLGHRAPRLAALALILVGLATIWRGVPAWQASAGGEATAACHDTAAIE